MRGGGAEARLACYAPAPHSVGTDFEFRSESRAYCQIFLWFPSLHLDERHVLSDSSLTCTYKGRQGYMPNDSYYSASGYKYNLLLRTMVSGRHSESQT